MWLCFDHNRAKKMESCACVLTIIEKKIGIMWVCFERYKAKKIGIMWVCFDHHRAKKLNHTCVF